MSFSLSESHPVPPPLVDMQAALQLVNLFHTAGTLGVVRKNIRTTISDEDIREGVLHAVNTHGGHMQSLMVDVLDRPLESSAFNQHHVSTKNGKAITVAIAPLDGSNTDAKTEYLRRRMSFLVKLMRTVEGPGGAEMLGLEMGRHAALLQNVSTLDRLLKRAPGQIDFKAIDAQLAKITQALNGIKNPAAALFVQSALAELGKMRAVTNPSVIPLRAAAVLNNGKPIIIPTTQRSSTLAGNTYSALATALPAQNRFSDSMRGPATASFGATQNAGVSANAVSATTNANTVSNAAPAAAASTSASGVSGVSVTGATASTAAPQAANTNSHQAVPGDTAVAARAASEMPARPQQQTLTAQAQPNQPAPADVAPLQQQRNASQHAVEARQETRQPDATRVDAKADARQADAPKADGALAAQQPQSRNDHTAQPVGHGQQADTAADAAKVGLPAASQPQSQNLSQQTIHQNSALDQQQPLNGQQAEAAKAGTTTSQPQNQNAERQPTGTQNAETAGVTQQAQNQEANPSQQPGAQTPQQQQPDTQQNNTPETPAKELKAQQAEPDAPPPPPPKLDTSAKEETPRSSTPIDLFQKPAEERKDILSLFGAPKAASENPILLGNSKITPIEITTALGNQSIVLGNIFGKANAREAAGTFQLAGMNKCDHCTGGCPGCPKSGIKIGNGVGEVNLSAAKDAYQARLNGPSPR